MVPSSLRGLHQNSWLGERSTSTPFESYFQQFIELEMVPYFTVASNESQCPVSIAAYLLGGRTFCELTSVNVSMAFSESFGRMET